ncbi:protein with RNI-like/FBD-like domains [Striga asiatica]|uniref:Protein with RNI-like/FBD-like domains n=1 Tax=Striga asiatica TaxID=4170 RepID=A0A5A7QQF9_STRAF|nr:protein with RNI-like/FBD-like domains [Striga asiatica]
MAGYFQQVPLDIAQQLTRNISGFINNAFNRSENQLAIHQILQESFHARLPLISISTILLLCITIHFLFLTLQAIGVSLTLGFSTVPQSHRYEPHLLRDTLFLSGRRRFCLTGGGGVCPIPAAGAAGPSSLSETSSDDLKSSSVSCSVSANAGQLEIVHREKNGVFWVLPFLVMLLLLIDFGTTGRCMNAKNFGVELFRTIKGFKGFNDVPGVDKSAILALFAIFLDLYLDCYYYTLMTIHRLDELDEMKWANPTRNPFHCPLLLNLELHVRRR